MRFSPLRLDQPNGRFQQLIHGAPDLVIGLRHTLGGKILADLAKDVVVPGFLEVGDDQVVGIGLGLGARQPELLGGPQAEQLVAPRRRLELQILVMDEAPLEPFLTFLEHRHFVTSPQIVPTSESASCRRFEVPTPPAASSCRNFKSKSGTRSIYLL